MTTSRSIVSGCRKKVSRVATACWGLPLTKGFLEYTVHDSLDLSLRFTVPPSRLRSGVGLKLSIGSVLSIVRYAADFFGSIRVLIAIRFHALIVMMAIINAASFSSPKSLFASS